MMIEPVTEMPAQKSSTKPSRRTGKAALQVMLEHEVIEKLDDLRRGRDDFPTKTDIIRELIEKAHSMRKPS
jgi:hypothetical protein